MPIRRLVPIEPGLASEWGFLGENPWEAVNPDSDDSTYITTDSVGNVTNLACGSGWAPYYGKILGISIGIRARQTTGSVGDGQIALSVTQDGTPHTIATWSSTLSWAGTVFHFRRESWSSVERLTRDDVYKLNVQVESSGVPTGGSVQISQLWLEIEYADTPYVYDPYDNLTPDDISGPLEWGAGGDPTRGFITPQKFLRIDDNDVTDFLIYGREIVDGAAAFNQDYVTEFETRLAMTNPSSVPTSMLFETLFRDDNRVVTLAYFKNADRYYLGLGSEGSTPSDLSTWRAYDNIQVHGGSLQRLFVRINRDEDPARRGAVDLYLNADLETPALSALYHTFAAPAVPTGTTSLHFGSPQPDAGLIRIDVDYVTWRTFKRDGGLYRSWEEMVPGTNRIRTDKTDPEVVPIFVLNPPGIRAGQSEQACVLEVNDPTQLCEISQKRQMETGPATYTVEVDYKMDIAGVEGEVLVQRLPDLYYWDGATWTDSESAVTLSNQTDRTRFSAMTGIDFSTAGWDLLITVRRKTSAGPPYKILVYKVFLDEE
jgi:hypothetical protein